MVKPFYQIIIPVFIFLFCISVSDIIGQENNNQLNADTCELISLKLDLVGNKFLARKNLESSLIIIGSSANNENKKYNSNRIEDAFRYLNKFFKIEKEHFVSANEKNQEILGYLKFYVDGQLIQTVRSTRKGVLCFGDGATFRDFK